MEKVFLTISKEWHKPEIHTTINGEGIAVDIELDDFIKALIHEIGPVRWVFTAGEFEKRVREAVIKVLEKSKQETSKVIGR